MPSKIIDIILIKSSRFPDTSAEYLLGLRELKRRLGGVRRWYTLKNSNEVFFREMLVFNDATHLLVVLDSSIIISDNLLAELDHSLPFCSKERQCSLPADPRSFLTSNQIDYATRRGLDRYVDRLQNFQRIVDYDGRDPWIFLIECKALNSLYKQHCDLPLERVPALLGDKTVIAQHAFIHSYSNYNTNSRSEMLALLPEDAVELLDIGGGEGGFSSVFMTERSGHATLLEKNEFSIAKARKNGLKVIEGDFYTVKICDKYDCVAMLDVLEHLESPLSALRRVRQFLRPGGTVLLSVPNIGYWAIISDLIEGRFDYLPVGILCNTHLRFFTEDSLRSLLYEAGFGIEKWEPVKTTIPDQMRVFLSSSPSWIDSNLESLSTESFHVLARRF